MRQQQAVEEAEPSWWVLRRSNPSPWQRLLKMFVITPNTYRKPMEICIGRLNWLEWISPSPLPPALTQRSAQSILPDILRICVSQLTLRRVYTGP
ncbi:unnamed protein product, partial [Iphiclides podalirius]